MLHVNFKTYNNYVTDSLYQWDINQDLIISGLNLSVAPEIHFANANMNRAIVRNATLESGVVRVKIPNSLLHEPLTIKAYVGLYEGEIFRTIEIIEIPVIAKAKPYDYTFTDDEEEIYSFNALENKVDEVNNRHSQILELLSSHGQSIESLNEILANLTIEKYDHTHNMSDIVDYEHAYDGYHARIEGGWYNGTDTNTFELTFSFVPKIILIMISASYNSYGYTGFGIALPEKNVTYYQVSGNVFGHDVSVEGTTAIFTANFGLQFNHTSVDSSGVPHTEAHGKGYWYYGIG